MERLKQIIIVSCTNANYILDHVISFLNASEIFTALI